MNDYPVHTTFPVHWGDMDALGHVNNTIYFRWFETARIAFFDRIGLKAAGKPAVGPILAHTSCDFLRPLTYPATVLAGARSGRIGRTSFTMEYGVQQVGGPMVARGSGVIVLVDYQTGAKVPIPADLRQAIAALAAPET